MKKMLLFLSGIAVFGIGLINMAFVFALTPGQMFDIKPVNVIISIFYIIAWTLIIIFAYRAGNLFQLAFSAVFFAVPLLSSSLAFTASSLFPETKLSSFIVAEWLEPLNLVFNAPLFGLGPTAFYTSGINVVVFTILATLAGGLLFESKNKRLAGAVLSLLTCSDIAFFSSVNAGEFGCFFRSSFLRSVGDGSNELITPSQKSLVCAVIYLIVFYVLLIVSIKIRAYGALKFFSAFSFMTAGICLFSIFGDWTVFKIPISVLFAPAALFTMAPIHSVTFFVDNTVFYILYALVSIFIGIAVYTKLRKMIDEDKKKHHTYRRSKIENTPDVKNNNYYNYTAN